MDAAQLQALFNGHVEALEKTAEALLKLTNIVASNKRRIVALEARVRDLETQNGNER